MSTNIFTKWFCCCAAVKDNLIIPYKEMTAIQQKHRIKILWKKARKVLLVTRLKMAVGSFSKQKVNEDLDDFDY